jgi:hypothetical protein
MVVIDTDVFLLEFAFHRDERYDANARFLTTVRDHEPAITVYNLMEILGQLSLNLAPDRLAQWRLWLQAAYRLIVLWPDPGELEATLFFHREIYEQPLARMQTERMAFVDSLILNLAERSPGVEALVTWNAGHFEAKSSLDVLTPEGYLAS